MRANLARRSEGGFMPFDESQEAQMARLNPNNEPDAAWWRDRLPFMAAHWYARNPKAGAIYFSGWSLHWELDGPVKVIDGQVVTVRERPRRRITLWHGLRHGFTIKLWPCKAFCEHGFYTWADWHRCAYVTAENPEGRVPDRERFPEDYDEHGVHYLDRTCFCDLKPEYSICSMHPDEDVDADA
jgi:hypothetical protein